MKRWLAGLSAAVFSIQSWAIEIGYMPILPVSQLFVGLEQGGLDDLAPEAKLIQFQNGPGHGASLAGRTTGRGVSRHWAGHGGQGQGRRY